MRRRSLALALALCVSFGSAGATETTRTALQSQNAASITSNASGQISGASLNALLGNIIDSTGMLQSSNSWTAQNIFNGAVTLNGSTTVSGAINFTGTVSFAVPFMPATTCAAGQFISALTTMGVGTCAAPVFPTLTGYIYANGASPPTASPTIPATAIEDFHGGAVTDAVAVCGADPTGVADSTTAINNCITTYGAVGLPKGTYKTASCINVSSAQSLVGAGSDATKIQINSTTASGVCVPAFAQKYMLKDFAVTRVGVPTNTAHGVNVGNGANNGLISNVSAAGHYDGFVLGATADSLCSWCVAQQNYNDGFAFVNDAVSQVMQWSLVHTLSEKNDGWGYIMTAANGATNSIQGSPWIAPQSFGNTAGGYAFTTTGTGVINDINLKDIVASTDGNTEVFISTNGGTNHQIFGGLIELAGTGLTGRTFSTPASNTGYGVRVTGSNGTVRISGAQITTNSLDGVNSAGTLSSLQVNDSTITENGNATANTYSGINVNGTSTTSLSISGVVARNITTANQRYGVVVNPTATDSTMAGSTAAGATADCAITGNMQLDGNVGTGCTPPAASWTTYSPTATCQVGSPVTHTDSGAYFVSGKTIFLRGKIVITDAGTCAAGWSFPIPASTFVGDGAGSGQETQATGNGLAISWANGQSALNIKKYDGTYIGAAGNTLTFSAVYEIP